MTVYAAERRKGVNILKKNKKTIFSLLVLLVVFVLIAGVIVVQAKPFSAPEEPDPAPADAPHGEENLPSQPESWYGHTVSFAAAADYREEGVEQITIYDGASGQTVSLSDPEEIEAFFRLFDGVEVTSEALISAVAMELSDATPFSVSLRYSGREHVFLFGDSALTAPYGNDAMVYLMREPLGLEERFRSRYGFAERADVYPIGQTVSFAEAVGFRHDEVTRIDLRDGATGCAATLQTAEEIRAFLSEFSQLPVTLKEVGNFSGYTIGVMLYQGNEKINFSFGNDYLKVPAGISGEGDKVYTLSLPAKTCEEIFEKYDFQ